MQAYIEFLIQFGLTRYRLLTFLNWPVHFWPYCSIITLNTDRIMHCTALVSVCLSVSTSFCSSLLSIPVQSILNRLHWYW